MHRFLFLRAISRSQTTVDLNHENAAVRLDTERNIFPFARHRLFLIVFLSLQYTHALFTQGLARRIRLADQANGTLTKLCVELLKLQILESAGRFCHGYTVRA
jgi:hypothetical protein